MTGNFMIDGDDGSSPQSPLHKTNAVSCSACGGTGTVYISCCGDDLTEIVGWPDTDLCPTCKEHCGTDGETCSECGGDGELEEEYDYEDYHERGEDY